MKPTFRLAAVLQVRETERDARRQDWIAACETEAAVKTRAEHLWEEIRAEQARRRSAFECGTVSMDDVQVRHRYELALRDELQSLQQAHAEATRIREVCESQLLLAEQALEAIERLRDRHEQEELTALRRREQFACDEAASRQTLAGLAHGYRPHRLSQP